MLKHYLHCYCVIIGQGKGQMTVDDKSLIIALRFRCIGIEKRLIDCCFNTVTCSVMNSYHIATLSCSGSKSR